MIDQPLHGVQGAERRRVRAHLERAYQLVLRAPTDALSSARRRRRAFVVRTLRHYIDAERYPLNDLTHETTPIFVDRRGYRCAVAALLEAAGQGGLVERVASRRSRARVDELASEPGLAEWLTDHGMQLSEAARIQPSYGWIGPDKVDWKPTASVVVSAQSAMTESVGLEAMLAFGARAGVRRNVRSDDGEGGYCHKSDAITVEYTRAIVSDRGATNQLGLLVHVEPFSMGNASQFYVLAGPLVSIDGDVRPGSGYGGQLDLGISARTTPVPIFIELATQALPFGDYATVRAGLQLGVVF